MAERLAGRVAVVTGASRGIGEAVARAFAREGATVVLAARKQADLDRVAAAIREDGGAAHARALHVGQLDAIAPWWDAVCAEVGAPDILVNNAGTNPYFGPMIATTWAAWDKTFEVNVKGPFEMARQLVSRHLARPEPRGPASVVTVSSILGHTAAPLQGVYGMTKAALVSMTKTLAAELGETGVRFNAIAPGVVDTRLAAAITSDANLKAAVLSRTPLRRVAVPDEIAGLAVYLASAESSYVTGQTIFVDGGYTAA